MPRLLRKEYAGAKYHITVRGNGRRRIFLWNEDRQRFLLQLEESLEQYGVILYAYALMSNHYHLLIETPRSNVSRFMQRLNTAYAMYFRNRHRRPGHILQGRFGGKLVEGDDYLLGLTRYIHLNPVRTREVQELSPEKRLEFLKSYRWSSYPGYVDAKKEGEIVDYRWRGLAGGGKGTQRTRYRAYVESMVLEEDEGLLEALRASRYAIGDEDFVLWVEGEVRRERDRRGGKDADVAWPCEGKVEMSRIKAVVAGSYDCLEDDLIKHGHAAGEVKSVGINLACQLTGLSKREIGEAFGGLSGAAVGYQCQKLVRELQKDKNLRARVGRIVHELENAKR